MTNIDTQKYWDNFLRSGKVNDYLAYKNTVNSVVNSGLNSYDTVDIDNDKINNNTRVNEMNNYADKNKGNYN